MGTPTWAMWCGCAAAALAACSADVVTDGEAELQPSPTEESTDVCATAIAQAQACMAWETFDELDLPLLAYQQTEQGPCGSCHRADETCGWIGYDEAELFAEWSTRVCLGTQLFDCSVAGSRVQVSPSGFLIDYPETSGTTHPSAALPMEMRDALRVFLEDAITRQQNGGCG